MEKTLFELRKIAEAAFLQAVDAADAGKALGLKLAQDCPQPEPGGSVYLVAFGKAAVPMMSSALKFYEPDRRAACIAVTNYENATEIEGCEVFPAAHPVPDENGLKASQRLVEILDDTTSKDVVIFLVSGGSSALLPFPIEGATLQDKVFVNQQLLSSGLGIEDMNTVRQSLSAFKGGKLLRYAEPAKTFSYILSDVLGDDLRAVGSGPTVGAVGNVSDARQILKGCNVWDVLPKHLQTILDRPDDTADLPQTITHLIGSNAISLERLAKSAGAQKSSPDLIGDVKDAAQRVVSEALKANQAIAFGGETTVQIKGSGKGGRNQELALRVAELMPVDTPWVFLSGGTDGRDGPTDAAGAIVDHKTLQKLKDANIDLTDVLARNDSYNALKQIDQLLMTGATGTNVADVQLFLLG